MKMSLRQEYRDLRRDHGSLVDDHLRLTENHHELRNAYNREVGQLLRRNQQQEALLKAADVMNQKLENAIDKVQSLLQRHLNAGETHVPARALWHVLHEAGITTAPKPELTHQEAIALKNTPKVEQQPEPKQEQKQVQSRGMRI